MKGDQKVIEYLNTALRSELTAVSQYWLHYRLQDDWGLGHMASKSREESIEEMNHADKLIDRIIFLEGHPNLQKLDPLAIGTELTLVGFGRQYPCEEWDGQTDAQREWQACDG